MSIVSKESIEQMSSQNIVANLADFNQSYEELRHKRETLNREVTESKYELTRTGRVLAKQNKRLERLKFFIENEIEEKQQLEATLKQCTRPANVEKKLDNTAEQLKKYKTEEQTVIEEHLATLQEIRALNNYILLKLEKVNKLDSQIACKKKTITSLKQGLSRLKVA